MSASGNIFGHTVNEQVRSGPGLHCDPRLLRNMMSCHALDNRIMEICLIARQRINLTRRAAQEIMGTVRAM